MRKLFSIIMALLATSALWAYDFQSGNLYYNITSDTTVEVTYQDLLSDSNYLDITSITIPEFVEHGGITYSVTSISEYAFTFCSSLSHITIPQSVTKIGSSAFSSTGINKDESNWENGGLYIDHCLVEVKSDFSGDFSLKEGTRLLATEVFYYRSSLKSITIPNSLQNISDRAFVGCDSLSSIIIEDGVNSIGNSAFEGCVSLSSIVIPNSISNIGEKAFFNCSSLRSIVIPEGVTTIERQVFTNCSSLESVTLPNTLKSIKNHAFHSCESLDSIQIPNSLTNIGASAFGYCYSLSSISIPNTIDSIKAGTFNFCTNLKSVELPESITSIGHIAFQNCYSLTSITIPKNVRSIGTDAFFQCLSLNSIVVEAINPPSLEETNNHFEIPNCYIPCGTTAAYEASDWAQYVGEFVEDCDGYQITYTSTDGNIVTPYILNAFNAKIISNTYENGVGIITFDAPITSIGDSAFYYCQNLYSITIPSNVTSIGYGTFYATPLTSVVWNAKRCNDFQNDRSNKKEPPFYHNNLQSFTFGKEVEHIPAYLLLCNSWQKLSSISIPNGVTSIGEGAFKGCSKFSSVTIGNNVTSIGERAFQDCSALDSIIIPEGVTSIKRQTFYGCSSLSSIILPQSVTSIEDYAFWGCSSLTSVIIPNSVTSIGVRTFNGCSSLTSMTIPNNVINIGDNAFYGCTLVEDNFINNSSLDEVSNNYWGATIVDQEIDGLLIRNDTVITCRKYVTSVNVPNSVVAIGNEAFYSKSISSITIPSSVTSIGEKAFYECSKLTSITIPNSITDIKWQVFYNCSSLSSVTLPKSITRIESQAFSGCSSLTSITIPSGVTDIGTWAFFGCGNSLTSIIVEEGNTIYDSRENCNAIIETKTNTLTTGCKSTVIPNSVTSIGNAAFIYCSSRTSVTIPYSITSIDDYAFSHCSSLATITIPNSVTSIGYGAFQNCNALTSITIPNSVASIGDYAFWFCSVLDTIYVATATPPTIESNTFSYTPASVCYIPCGTLTAYQASAWAQYVGEFVEECDEDDSASAIENTPIQSPITSCQKIFRDGQVIIIRHGVEYNAMGQKLSES